MREAIVQSIGFKPAVATAPAHLVVRIDDAHPSPQVFPIPLRRGGRAVLSLPLPLSREDFDMVIGTLGAWRDALVTAGP
jgi:hypothetical protein